MRKHLSLTIEQEQDGLSLKTVFMRYMNLSRHEISRLKFSDGILVNGEKKHVSYIVEKGDQIELVFPEQETSYEYRNNIDVESIILYEDEDMLIVDKPAGIPVHPGHGHLEDSLGSAVSAYCGNSIRAIGRLDKDVCGVMVYAKNQPSAARLWKEKSEGVLTKTYLAVCEGVFEKKSDTLVFHIEKEEGKRARKASFDSEYNAVTRYEVLEQDEDSALVKVNIETGRTHQIRAGFGMIGHPIIGDTLYGSKVTGQVLLQCCEVKCVQPFTGEEIHVKSRKRIRKEEEG